MGRWCDRSSPIRRAPMFLLMVSISAAAAADRVWLRNGNYLEGTVSERDSGEVEIRSTLGTLVLPADSVARIERAETVEEEVERILAEAVAVDSRMLYELALYCDERGAHTLATRLLWEVLTVDPEHEGARRALGFRLYEDRWVTEEEYHELRGEVLFRGEWMSPETRAGLLRLETLQAEAEAERRRQRARDAALRLEIERLRQEQTRSSPYYPGYPVYLGAPVLPPLVPRPPIHRPPPSHRGAVAVPARPVPPLPRTSPVQRNRSSFQRP